MVQVPAGIPIQRLVGQEAPGLPATTHPHGIGAQAPGRRRGLRGRGFLLRRLGGRDVPWRNAPDRRRRPAGSRSRPVIQRPGGSRPRPVIRHPGGSRPRSAIQRPAGSRPRPGTWHSAGSWRVVRRAAGWTAPYATRRSWRRASRPIRTSLPRSPKMARRTIRPSFPGPAARRFWTTCRRRCPRAAARRIRPRAAAIVRVVRGPPVIGVVRGRRRGRPLVGAGRRPRLDLDAHPVLSSHPLGDHVDHQADGVPGPDHRGRGPYVDLTDGGLGRSGGRRHGNRERPRRERDEEKASGHDQDGKNRPVMSRTTTHAPDGKNRPGRDRTLQIDRHPQIDRHLQVSRQLQVSRRRAPR